MKILFKTRFFELTFSYMKKIKKYHLHNNVLYFVHTKMGYIYVQLVALFRCPYQSTERRRYSWLLVTIDVSVFITEAVGLNSHNQLHCRSNIAVIL